MLLGVLPLVAASLLTLIMISVKPLWDWRLAFLRSAIISWSYMIVMTEFLSLFQLLGQSALTLIWALPILPGLIWIIRRWRSGKHIWKPRLGETSFGWTRSLLWISILMVLFITALIAWIWNPNTWDSLRYHLPRVAHWAQERAVVHYATGIEVQNGIGPFAEYAILHTYILSQGDRWVNFVQWLAMFSSMIGAMVLTKLLGGNKNSEYLSAALIVSLPMGIAQATNTMTDYVVAFFVLAAAIEIVNRVRKEWNIVGFVFLGMATGIAIGSKPTAYAYLLPFACYSAVTIFKTRGVRYLIKGTLIVVAIISVLNLGHMTRNVQTFGNPMGANYLIEEQANQIMTPRGLLSNLSRHASLHAGTPWEPVNKIVMDGIIKIHLIVDLSLDDPRTTSIGPFMFWKPRTEETFAGNSLHAYMYLLSFVLSIVFFHKMERHLYIYGLLVAFTFVIFSFVFKWQVFSARYHLPFFVLFAPFAGTVFARLLPPGLGNILGIGFVVLAWPWIFNLGNRPFSKYTNQFFSDQSSPSLSEFLNLDERRYEEFAPLTDPIQEASCSAVGIMISGNGREYPIWSNLGAPREDLEIEWIVVGTPSDKYRDHSFEPCAVICQHCPDEWKEFSGLPLYLEKGDHKLYLQK